jgi:hypothetical protein
MAISLRGVTAVWTPKGYVNYVNDETKSAADLSKFVGQRLRSGSGYGGTPDTGYARGRSYD